MSAPRKRSATRDRLVAHHEAGHAVVALSIGQAFQCVTIESDIPGSMGHVRQDWPKGFDPDTVGSGPRGRRLVEGRIIMLLAGPAAGRRLLGTRRGAWGSGADRHEAVNCLLLLAQDPEEVSAYYKLLDVRAKGHVKRGWGVITALAEVLLRERRLSYRRVRALYREAKFPKERRDKVAALAAQARAALAAEGK